MEKFDNECARTAGRKQGCASFFHCEYSIASVGTRNADGEGEICHNKMQDNLFPCHLLCLAFYRVSSILGACDHECMMRHGSLAW